MSFADAINAELARQAETMRQYGRFMAQAGIALTELEPMPPHDRQLVREGYHEQLAEFPNG